MAKDSDPEPTLPSAPEKHKAAIASGELTKDQARELYDHFEAMPQATRAQEINKYLAGVYKEVGQENFHKLVGTLLEVECDIVKERNSDPDKRCAQYIRNSSLAKNAFGLECEKLGLGKEVYEALRAGDKEVAINAIVNVQVPPPILEHYAKTVKPFYKENGNEQGGVTNLIFHGIQTTVTTKYPESAQEMGVISKAYSELAKVTKEEAHAAVDAQISRKPLPAEELAAKAEQAKGKYKEAQRAREEIAPPAAAAATPTPQEQNLSFGQKVKQFFTAVIEAISEEINKVFGTAEPPAAPPSPPVTTPAPKAPPAKSAVVVHSTPPLSPPSTPSVAKAARKSQDHGR